MGDWEPIPKNDGWEPIEQPSELEAGLRGGAQGLSMGYSDEALAGLRNLGAMTGISKPGTYDEFLKTERLKNTLAEKAHPNYYLGGNLTGAVGSAFIPGIGAAKGAGLAARLARLAGQGAIAGYGYSNAKNDEDKYKDIAVGTGTGLVGGAAGEAVGAAASRAAPYVRELAKKTVLLHLDPIPTTVLKLGDKRLLNASGQALDEGAIPIWGTVKKTAKRLAPLASEAGDKLNQIVSQSKGEVDPLVVAKRIQSEVIDPIKAKAPSADKALVNSLQSKLQDFIDEHLPQMPQKKIPLSLSEGEKTRFGNKAWEGPQNTELNKKLKGFAAVLSDEGSKAEPSAAFEAAKSRSGNLLNALKMTQKAAAKKGAYKLATDASSLFAGATLLASDDPRKNKLGEALLIGRALTRGKLSGLGANSLNGLSRLMQNPDFTAAMSKVIPGVTNYQIPNSPWEQIQGQ